MTLHEITLGSEIIAFVSELDAAIAAAVLCKGYIVEGSADPRRPQARARLVLIEVRRRTVTVQLPRRAVSAVSAVSARNPLQRLSRAEGAEIAEGGLA